MTRDAEGLPAWLLAATLAAVLGVAALLWAETQVLRPYYAQGDESIHVDEMLAISHGEPLHWRVGRGDLERNAQWLWWRAVGSGPGRLPGLTLLVFGMELVLLAVVARRWWGAEAAAWALCCDLLCADTWMRARSILAFAWLPAELLLLGWLGGKVRAGWSALAWGVAAACLVMDYEGALLALPGLVLVCLALEPEFRRRWPWTLGAMAGTLGLIAGMHSGQLSAYSNLRHAVNLSGSAGLLVRNWLANLGQLVVGGEPMPYFSVWHWPAVALWALPLMAVGAGLAWRGGRWTVLVWAALAALAGQAAVSSYGVAAHRLSAAWPALCLLGGAGGAWLRRSLGDRAWLWMGLLLALGGAAELDAFCHHMGSFGERLWGRSRNMAAAAGIIARDCPPDQSVDTALMELVRPTIGFHLQPRPGQGRRAWVVLPAELRCVAGGAGQVLELHHGMDDEPVLLLQAQGDQARRFDALESDLRTLLPLPVEAADIRARELAWLAKGGHDPWARWTVEAMNLRTYWMDQPVDPVVLADLLHSSATIPAPWAIVGRYLAQQNNQDGFRLFDHALALDPYYGPALIWKAAALRSQGRGAEADAALALLKERQVQRQWLVGE